MKSTANRLQARVNEIEELFENFEYEDIGSEAYEKLVSEVYEIEDEARQYVDYPQDSIASLFRRIGKKIDKIKRDNDFYDADAELDAMFPNRHDEDFDEDSMSYDSVFGDD